MKRTNSFHSYSTKNSNKTSKEKIFNFYQLKNGSKITCHGRPKKIDIKLLKENHEVNYILTIQHSKENPELIKKFIDEVASGIMWKNLPLEGANMALFMKPQTQKMVIDCLFQILDEMIIRPINIFLHCAAGVHRTGTILYSLLRLTGEDPSSAMEAIKIIRMETYRNCGSDRIRYAEEFLVKPMLKILEERSKKNTEK